MQLSISRDDVKSGLSKESILRLCDGRRSDEEIEEKNSSSFPPPQRPWLLMAE
jgi:hypothetical protein